MAKPIDDLKSKDLKDWQRGQLDRTIESRFGIGIATLNNSSQLKLYIEGTSKCPECGACTYPKRVPLQDGNVMFYLQCVASEDKDHGFSKFSRHGNQAPMGRRPGSANKHKTSTVRVEVEMKQEEVKPTIKEKVEVRVSGKVVHPEVIRSSRYVLAGERNIYYTGPAGTGKSTGAEHLYEILKSQDKWSDSVIEMITVSMATFVSDLAGFLDRLNKGEFIETDLVKALKKPGVVVVDEADKGNPNLAGFWNVILANKKINTPGGTFDRHPDNVIVFIGNTTGHAPSKQYSGSVRQDFATLDRFRCFNVGFDENVERAAIPTLNESVYSRVRTLRETAKSTGLQRILGTRWLKRVNQAVEVEGLTPERAIKTIMQDESWSADEILASGV